MRSRRYVTWGSVAALLAAAAIAQQPGSNQPGRTGTTTGQPEDRRMYSLTNSSDPKSMLKDLEGMWRVEMRINPSQWYGNGSWTGSMPHTDPARPGTPGTGSDGANRNPGTTGNQPSTTPGTQPGTTTNQPRPSTTTNQSGDQVMAGGVSVTGYGEKRWVLGGNILQESIVVPDLGDMSPMRGMEGRDAAPRGNDATGRDASSTTPPGSTPDAERPSIEALESDRMFQGISFLSFNEGSNTFDYVCMDSRQGDIHHAMGTLDAGNNRIIFDIQDMMGGGSHGATPGMPRGTMNPNDPSRVNDPSRPVDPNDPNRNDPNRANDPSQPRAVNPTNPSSTTPTQPDGTTRQPSTTQPVRTAQTDRPYAMSGDHSDRAFSNVRVVVEIMSNDQHKVTMYRSDPGQIWSEGVNRDASGTGTSRTTTPGQPGTTGNQPSTNPNSPNNTNTPTQPGDMNRNTATNTQGFRTAMGEVIWEATYTRVDGAEASRYRQYLQRADQLRQATVDDDADDDR